MSSTEEAEATGTAADQAYFRALEERFLALRGRATLLAAEDWETAREWRRSGIPLELVVAVMEQLFDRQRERRSKRGISSLRYFRAAVAAAWAERQQLAAGGARVHRDPGPPVAVRLAALAAALPADLPGREELAARLTRLDGSFAEVEAALEALDRDTVARLAGTLAGAELAAIEARVARAVGAALAGATPEQLAAAHERLRVQALRERFRLPVLSLFAPAALGGED